MRQKILLEVSGFLAILVLLLGVAFLEYKYFNLQSPTQDSGVADTGQINPPASSSDDFYNKVYASTTQDTIYNSAVPDNLVVIYTTQASSTLSSNRVWPALNIWRKVGNAAPESLGTVGDVGNYAASITLSPDRTLLAVNLERSVELIEVSTKKSRTVFTTERGVTGVVFSADSKKLLVAEGSTFYRQDNNYALYAVDTQTDAQKTVFQGTAGDFDPLAWRPDGGILFEFISYKDCGGSLQYLDPSTGTVGFIKNEENYSPTGAFVLEPTQTLPSPFINEMCGPDTVPAVMSVVDPISGKMYGSVGRPHEYFSFVAFSPDSTQVLYKSSVGVSQDSAGTSAYYLQTVGTSTTPVSVPDPNSALSQWKSDALEVMPASGVQNQQAFYVNNKPMLTVSDQTPVLLVQYFK